MLYIIVLIIGLVLGFVTAKGSININHNYIAQTQQQANTPPQENTQEVKAMVHSVAAVMQNLMGVDTEE